MTRESLIDAVYRGATEPSAWPAIVERLSMATGSMAGILMVHVADRTGMAPVSYNIDPQCSEVFFERFARDSQLFMTGARIAPGDLYSAAEITQSETYRASAEYREAIAPQGWSNCVGLGLGGAVGAARVLTLMRPPSAIELTTNAGRRLQRLSPHIQRAHAAVGLILRAQSLNASLALGVQLAGFGLLMLNRSGRVVFANPFGERVVRELSAIGFRPGRPCPREAAEPLFDLMAKHESTQSGTFRIDRAPGETPLIAHVVPLPPASALVPLEDAAATAVFIVDPAGDLGARTRTFATLHGLTPGETRVLALVLRGEGVLAAAHGLALSEATARLHLTHIFEKTGARRQAEFVRRFFATSLPPDPSIGEDRADA